MKPNIIHSIVVCLTAFTLPFMVACSSQEESLPEKDSYLTAVLTIDLGDTNYGTTRTTPTDGGYAPGSGWENFIDFPNKDFRCYLFDKDSKFISAPDKGDLYFLGVEEDKKYQIRFRLKDTEEIKNALTGGCRFVFLANWGKDNYPIPTPGVTTIEMLCAEQSAVFEFSQQKTQLSADNLIPMYGVKEFETGLPDFAEGQLYDIGTINLLRAFAKVEVNITFEDFAETPVVTSVSLTHSNDKGFKAPANITKEEQYVTGSWLTDYTPVHIPEDAKDIALELTKETKDENTEHYIAYVPEYRNVDDENKEPLGNPSQIKINFTIGDVAAGGLDVEGYVNFRYSDTPPTGVTPKQPFDIARNNWYKFNVIVKGKDIDWTVDVIPFTSIDLNPDYGLGKEDFTGYVVGKDKKGNICWYDGNYYDTEKAVPLYLGPKDNPGKSVSINGKEYLLVYADYERTAAKLDHFFEMETRKKYLLDPIGRTGYSFTLNPEHPEWGPDIYYNKHQMRVWLDEGYNEWTEGTKWDENQQTNVEAWFWQAGTTWYRTLNEWDRLNWNQAIYWNWPRVYPKYWFDIFGNRYPWSEGETKEKRKAKLEEKIGTDWIQYLK